MIGLLTRDTPFPTYALLLNDELTSDEETPAIVTWWSVTKTVIAAAALIFLRDQCLSLDECCPGQKHTLRQLLQHEVGCADYGVLAEYHSSVKAGIPPWTMHELLATTPGRKWQTERISALVLNDHQPRLKCVLPKLVPHRYIYDIFADRQTAQGDRLLFFT
jgi:hypothetical protein